MPDYVFRASRGDNYNYQHSTAAERIAALESASPCHHRSCRLPLTEADHFRLWLHEMLTSSED